MAKDYKKELERLKGEDTRPLTTDETKLVNSVEEFIDGKIESEMNTDNLCVRIPLEIVRFEKGPNGGHLSFTRGRRQFLEKTLLDKYRDLGWKATEDIDDSYGMAPRPAMMVLSGK